MPKSFNVILFQPAGYVHAMALKEAAEYIHFMLTACGYDSRFSLNHIAADAHNIILGAHNMTRDDMAHIPSDSIIFNSEKLESAFFVDPDQYRQLLNSHCVWDYSLANLSRIGHGRKSFIPFYYCQSLVRTGNATRDREKGAPILFYGWTTQRRADILKKLQLTGVPVQAICGQYDLERDRRMFRSLAVLNIHKDQLTMFEPLRCFYPLTNQIPVISEEVENDPTADAFRDSIFFLKTDELVEGISNLCKDLDTFQKESHEKLSCFQQKSAVAEITSAVKLFLESIS